MKKLLFTLVCLMSSYFIFAQCTPNASTGDVVVSPPPDSIACIERGVFYDQIIYTENYPTLSFNIGIPVDVTLGPVVIDSLVNFPCGIEWETNKSDNTFAIGEAGCIRVFGTTNDSVGQYPLEIYMTVTLGIPLLGVNQAVSGELGRLTFQLDSLLTANGLSLAQLGIVLPELNYYSRVIEQSGTCPDIDTSSSANNLTASCPTPQPVGIEDQIAGNTQSFKVYPNPNTGQFTINIAEPSHEAYTLRIFDLQGKQVYQEMITNLYGNKVIEVSQLSKGIYTVHLSSLSSSSIQKVAVY